MEYINYLKIILLLLILDLIWLIFFFARPFGKMIGQVQGSPMIINPIGMLVSYFVLVLFAMLFIPRTKNGFEAFLLGFLLYAVYESTNYATLRSWDPKIGFIDSLWGGTLFFIIRYFTM